MTNRLLRFSPLPHQGARGAEAGFIVLRRQLDRLEGRGISLKTLQAWCRFSSRRFLPDTSPWQMLGALHVGAVARAVRRKRCSGSADLWAARSRSARAGFCATIVFGSATSRFATAAAHLRSEVQRGARGQPRPAALAYVTVWQPTAATWSSLMQHLTSVVLLDGGQHPGGRRHCWR